MCHAQLVGPVFSFWSLIVQTLQILPWLCTAFPFAVCPWDKAAGSLLVEARCTCLAQQAKFLGPGPRECFRQWSLGRTRRLYWEAQACLNCCQQSFRPERWCLSDPSNNSRNFMTRCYRFTEKSVCGILSDAISQFGSVLGCLRRYLLPFLQGIGFWSLFFNCLQAIMLAFCIQPISACSTL